MFQTKFPLSTLRVNRRNSWRILCKYCRYTALQRNISYLKIGKVLR